MIMERKSFDKRVIRGEDNEKAVGDKIIEIDNLEDKVGDVDLPWITGWRVSMVILALGLILNWLFESPQLQMFALFLGLFVLWKGFTKVQHTERYVIERLGKYWKVLKPGPNILLYGVDEIVAMANYRSGRYQPIPAALHVHQRCHHSDRSACLIVMPPSRI